MELYIHFGIYKAGSSYLQYILANSREYLESKGIYFPGSKSDSKMLQGKISPGNADGLETAIIKKDIRRIESILKNWSEVARNRNCDKVLISAEALVHQMAKKKELEFLIHESKNVGYEKIHAMGFFRDLVDHAISTYKHRAKSGKIPNYEHWIKEIYETPALMRSLVDRRQEDMEIQWTFLKFHKDSDALKSKFFKDWLKIEGPHFSGRPSINESVTISEVLVMNEINKLYPGVTDYFVNDLKNLPSKEKASDSELEECFGSVFLNHLEKHQGLMDQFNAFFSDGEELRLCRVGLIKQDITDLEPVIRLNSKQLTILLNRLMYFGYGKGKLIYWRRKMVFYLPELFLKAVKKT